MAVDKANYRRAGGHSAATAVLLGVLRVACAGGADDAVFAGNPRVLDPGLSASVHVLDNPGFRIGYSERLREPLWVAFRAGPAHGHRFHKQRWSFEPDPRTQAQVKSEDYVRSHYQRGHLAPNFLIGKLYGGIAQHATFLMSNIAPQSPRLNELVWQRLEEAEADVVAPAAGKLWVVTGPVFGQKPRVLKSGIAIPEAFYRVWLERDSAGAPRAIAFIVPQKVCGTEPLSGFVVSVADVETRAHLDFFAELPEAIEKPMEQRARPADWDLAAFDRKPPRYGDKFDLSECPP